MVSRRRSGRAVAKGSLSCSGNRNAHFLTWISLCLLFLCARGYNRFYRIDLLGDEGYLGSPDNVAAPSGSAADAASPGGAAASAASASSSSAAAPAAASGPAKVDDEILFRFYIRPPSTHLLALESRAWIAQLEQHAHRQARIIRRMQRQARKPNQQQRMASSSAAAAAASPSASRAALSAPRTSSDLPSEVAADSVRRGAGAKAAAPITLRSAALRPAAAAAAVDSSAATAAAPAPRSSSSAAAASSPLPPSSTAQLSRAESEERDHAAALQLHAQLNEAMEGAGGGEADEEDHEEHEPLDHDHQRYALHEDMQLGEMQSSDSEASDGAEGGGDDELLAAIASDAAAARPSSAAAAPAAAPSNRRA